MCVVDQHSYATIISIGFGAGNFVTFLHILFLFIVFPCWCYHENETHRQMVYDVVYGV